jgi:hypothetical protein
MAARKGPRRRRPEVVVSRPADDTSPLPPWVEGRIARGKTTEAEYREAQGRRLTERREDLERRVPPLVEDEGAAAVARWVEEWLVPDPRIFLLDDPGPRAPLP